MIISTLIFITVMYILCRLVRGSRYVLRRQIAPMQHVRNVRNDVGQDMRAARAASAVRIAAAARHIDRVASKYATK